MNKTDLVNVVAGKTELTKKDSSKVVEAVLSSITESLANDEKVSIFGFGNFEVRNRAARNGHNPATGEKIRIDANKTVGFKPAKALKDSVKGS